MKIKLGKKTFPNGVNLTRSPVVLGVCYLNFFIGRLHSRGYYPPDDQKQQMKAKFPSPSLPHSVANSREFRAPSSHYRQFPVSN